jgi:predicted transposase YdaD
MQRRQIVVIYPTRSLEQSNAHPYRALLNCPQVHRVYLNELGEIQQLPLGVALMVLTTVEETQAPEKARYIQGYIVKPRKKDDWKDDWKGNLP